MTHSSDAYRVVCGFKTSVIIGTFSEEPLKVDLSDRRKIIPENTPMIPPSVHICKSNSAMMLVAVWVVCAAMTEVRTISTLWARST